MPVAFEKAGDFYSGTSNIVLPVANKTLFPAEFHEKSRLNYYASLFNSLEVNSTFYKIPLPKTIEKWAADVPVNFRFTFKLWRGITHNKGLIFDDKDVCRFMQIISPAAQHAGCLLVQFPASINVQFRHKVEMLFRALRQYDPQYIWRIAIEFRHPSWYKHEIYELLEQYHINIVIHDMPASATPFIELPHQDCMYVRFHGPVGDYRGSYPEHFLAEHAQYINQWLQQGKNVYVYFNNTIGNALENLITLNKLVAHQLHK